MAAHVAAAAAAGAEVLFHEPHSVPARGFFAAPAIVGGRILRGAQSAHAVTRDESFGPVVALVVVDGRGLHPSPSYPWAPLLDMVCPSGY